jgi:3-(3-hydroxy-phenyl)propionate hydroxylase
MNSSAVPVVIIGAGPTGLTAATLLAQYGVECLVLERWEGLYAQPRAVHLDDEMYRLLARMGVGEEFAAMSRACHGLRLVDRNMGVLAEFSRGTAEGKHGFAEANMFDQPQLEEILRNNLKRFDGVTVRGSAEVTALSQDGDGPVHVDFTDRLTGQEHTIESEYVLGSDGANSLARTAIGAITRTLNFEQRWLVVDVASTAELDQWEGVHQVCDPRRAATYMRIGATRYRFEFRLNPGETVDDYRDPARLHPLIVPWTKDIPLEQLHVVRVAEYTFRAQVADRWRDRRIFLLGDAAHLTPPFIGQGLCAGLRDAANLSWKLAGVLDGLLPERVLATYQAERKPHATALIRLAKVVGTAMTEGGEFGNLLRRVLAPRLHRIPAFSGHILNSETPPLKRTELVAGRRVGRTLAGRLCPNVLLDDGRRFDHVAGGRFALVTTVEPSPAQQADLRRRGVVLISARPGSELHAWLRRGRATAAAVRPDGTVLRAGRHLHAVCDALADYRSPSLASL